MVFPKPVGEGQEERLELLGEEEDWADTRGGRNARVERSKVDSIDILNANLFSRGNRCQGRIKLLRVS